MKRRALLQAILGSALITVHSPAVPENTKGSKRKGGTNSHGKGSHYVPPKPPPKKKPKPAPKT